jgi:hypothetical protein
MGKDVAPRYDAVNRDQPRDARGQKPEPEERLDGAEDAQQRALRRDIAVAEARQVDERYIEGVGEVGVILGIESATEQEPVGKVRKEDQRPAHRKERRPGRDNRDIPERSDQTSAELTRGASRCPSRETTPTTRRPT